MYQYSVFDYCAMVKDETRVAAYKSALTRVVGKDSVVLDLGAGIGLFSIMAAQLGAARVYAVEPNDAIDVGPELAKAAGVLDRVTFLKKSIWDLDPPEKVDVMFYDLRGTTPLFEENFRIVNDVRARWLKPEGVYFPAKDTLFAAIVSAEKSYDDLAAAWRALDAMGIPSARAKQMIVNSRTNDQAHPITEDDILTESFAWAELKYGEPPLESVSGEKELAVTRAGNARGVCVWFATELLPGIGYDTRPGTTRTYNRAFFPFEKEVTLAIGDSVKLSLMAISSGRDWGWNITVRRKNGSIDAPLRHSTFFSQPQIQSATQNVSNASTPILSTEGERRVKMLSAFDGKTSLEDLAVSFSRAPTDAGKARALDELKELARKYSR